MLDHCRKHLPDADLMRSLAAHAAEQRISQAVLIADIAEVDRRKLYLAEGHPSMFGYCVHVLRFSEDEAYKRIRAARAARQFPQVYDLLADGRLHLTAVVLLAPHLAPERAAELLQGAVHRTREQVERYLADRFPRPDLPARITALGPAVLPGTGAGRRESGRDVTPEPERELVPEPVSFRATELTPGPGERSACDRAPEPARPSASPASESPTPPAAIAARRFAIQVTVPQETHDLLRYAQALLGHEAAPGDLAGVLHRALETCVNALEKRKFAKLSRLRAGRRRPSSRSRDVPAEVRRKVWERDRGQCTFAGGSGHRCPARSRLEFDHAQEFARGGESTFENLRLRCRAHNQYTAERTFGAAFMHEKRSRSSPAEHQRPGDLRAGRGRLAIERTGSGTSFV